MLKSELDRTYSEGRDRVARAIKVLSATDQIENTVAVDVANRQRLVRSASVQSLL